MKKLFDMVEAVQRAKVKPIIVIHGVKNPWKLTGQCPHCSIRAPILLHANFCYNCGQHLT